ncbi:MAG: DUF4271 domain-containing protein [Crocinitomicaceae bacterium]|nr:DUF4271 domain-containing protein [Crocinitomicaceae bacterium]MBK8927039.1 DUF4271 domain-containing protein [Crocinitomicaceae bacterium]
MDFIEYLQGTSVIGQQNPLKESFNWVFWSMIFFNLVAFAYVKMRHPGYIPVLFRTGFYNRQLYQNMSEDLKLSSFASYLLMLAYQFTLALMLYVFIKIQNPTFVFILLGALILMNTIKFLFMRFVAVISQVQQGVSEHRLNHFVYGQIATFMLTPIMASVEFLQADVQFITYQILAIVVILLILTREFQSFVRAAKQRVPIFYIILYLCTLELIPLIVLIRVLVR